MPIVAPAQNSPATGPTIPPVELEEEIGKLMLLEDLDPLPAGGFVGDDALELDIIDDPAFRTGATTLLTPVVPIGS